MQILTTQDLRNWREEQRSLSHSVAFVSTMGNLHEGHLSLVKAAHKQADRVIVSLFVNPTQFGAGEDFDTYPRTLDEDMDKLQQAEVDAVFTPAVGEVYPVYPPRVTVKAGAISCILCNTPYEQLEGFDALLILNWSESYSIEEDQIKQAGIAVFDAANLLDATTASRLTHFYTGIGQGQKC